MKILPESQKQNNIAAERKSRITHHASRPSVNKTTVKLTVPCHMDQAKKSGGVQEAPNILVTTFKDSEWLKASEVQKVTPAVSPLYLPRLNFLPSYL
jgi:hypothetical protein